MPQTFAIILFLNSSKI